MIHKRPLHVWKELLHVIAMQPKCHMGELDYENLFEFNRTGRVKMPEKLFYTIYGESPTNPNGANIPGMTGEHLSHVIFGHKEVKMKPPSQEETCQNFIKGCLGSPCTGTVMDTLSMTTEGHKLPLCDKFLSAEFLQV